MRNALLLTAALVLVAPAAAAPPDPRAAAAPLLFPVVGTATYTDDFGQPRAGGPHQGIDILAERHAPAIAVEAGRVKLWTTSASAGCMLYLYGVSGTTYLYIHLNNDLTARNDNRGRCVAGTAYAPGLTDGARVAAGALVGYVGDSGDANGIHPHLHFEVHPHDGKAVDPYPYLRQAQPLLFYAKQGTRISLQVTGTIVSSLGGMLDVQASEVRANSARPVATDRVLSLGVAPDAVVSSPHLFGAVEALTRGLDVSVRSTPLRATLAAERGDAGAITASFIAVG
jgi:hypothetical protein